MKPTVVERYSRCQFEGRLLEVLCRFLVVHRSWISA